LVEKAKKALEGLTIEMFRDLKALKSPPKDIEKTFTACLHLLCKYHKDVPIDKNGKLKTESPWKTALALLKDPAKFLEVLIGFKAEVDADRIPGKNFDAIRGVLADETFTPEIVMKSSPAAAGLCDWITNITMYYDVVVSVEPKKLAVKEAQETLAAANQKKAEVDTLVAKLNAELAELMAAF
jgi:dynein heavy chain